MNSLKFASENLVAVVNDVLDHNRITSYDLVFEKIEFVQPKTVPECSGLPIVALLKPCPSLPMTPPATT